MKNSFVLKKLFAFSSSGGYIGNGNNPPKFVTKGSAIQRNVAFLFLFSLATVTPVMDMEEVVPTLPQAVVLPPASEKSKETPVNETSAALSWEQKNADQPFIYLYNHYDMKLNEDWSYEEVLNYRIKIQKDGANYLGEQKVYYDKSREEVNDIQAYVIAPDGTKYPSTKIQDLPVYQGSPMYSDFRVKVITLPQVGPGTIIDVFVKGKTFRKAIKDNYWERIDYPAVPTKSETSTFVFPVSKNIQFKQFNANFTPVIEKNQDFIRYTFIFNETEDLQETEPYLPPYEEIRGYAVFSSIPDWKLIADWYRDLVKLNSRDDETIRAKALELTANKVTQREKALAILEFIQDHFRYVAMNFGDNTVEPHPLSEIYQNRYGDCKDWSLLARKLLDYAGIKSSVCLFNDEYAGDPQNSLPQISAFDHVILEVEVDGQHYFVDPQTKGYDLGEHPSSYDGAHVMVIDEEGFRFDRLPPLDEKANAILSEGTVEIKEDGSAKYDVAITFGTDYSQSFRYGWQQATDRDREKMLEAMEHRMTKGDQVFEHRFEGLEDRYGPVKFVMKFERPDAYPVINDMIILKEEMENRVSDFAEKKRKFPIYMASNVLVSHKAQYILPPGYWIDYVPDDFDLNMDIMQVKCGYVKEKNMVRVETAYRTKRAQMQPDLYPQVQDFFKKFYKLSNRYIVLKTKPRSGDLGLKEN